MQITLHNLTQSMNTNPKTGVTKPQWKAFSQPVGGTCIVSQVAKWNQGWKPGDTIDVPEEQIKRHSDNFWILFAPKLEEYGQRQNNTKEYGQEQNNISNDNKIFMSGNISIEAMSAYKTAIEAGVNTNDIIYRKDVLHSVAKEIFDGIQRLKAQGTPMSLNEQPSKVVSENPSESVNIVQEQSSNIKKQMKEGYDSVASDNEMKIEDIPFV